MIANADALHILPADVQNAVDVWIEEGSGLIVRDGLDLAVIEQEGGLQQRLAVEQERAISAPGGSCSPSRRMACMAVCTGEP